MTEVFKAMMRSVQRHSWLWNATRSTSALRESFNLDVLTEVVVTKHDVMLRLRDGRAFAWDASHPNALLTIPSEGMFEKREFDFVCSWIRRGDIVFDVGANFGWYTTLFRQLLGGTGAVHSFEPVPSAFQLLERHVQLNPSPTQTIINNCALGENSGRNSMWVPTRGGRGTPFASLKKQESIGRQLKIDVEVMTMTDYAQSRDVGSIDFVKCDVEGAELLVARGFRDLLDRGIRPVWLVELSAELMRPFGAEPGHLLDVFSGQDYALCDIVEGGALSELDRAEVHKVSNLVMVPRERLVSREQGLRQALVRA